MRNLIIISYDCATRQSAYILENNRIEIAKSFNCQIQLCSDENKEFEYIKNYIIANKIAKAFIFDNQELYCIVTQKSIKLML